MSRQFYTLLIVLHSCRNTETGIVGIYFEIFRNRIFSHILLVEKPAEHVYPNMQQFVTLHFATSIFRSFTEKACDK